MPNIRIFREGTRIGVRVLKPDHERGCDWGVEVSIKIGIGLFAPELRFEHGEYTRITWRDHATGQRFDYGYGFNRGVWVSPYGVSGSRWDRAFRIALMKRQRTRQRRSTRSRRFDHPVLAGEIGSKSVNTRSINQLESK